jgi:hypothetical protein
MISTIFGNGKNFGKWDDPEKGLNGFDFILKERIGRTQWDLNAHGFQTLSNVIGG